MLLAYPVSATASVVATLSPVKLIAVPFQLTTWFTASAPPGADSAPYEPALGPSGDHAGEFPPLFAEKEVE